MSDLNDAKTLMSKGSMFKTNDDVEEYLSGDKVECLICGRRYKLLSAHLKSHDLSKADYCREFGIPSHFGLCSKSHSDTMAAIANKRMEDDEYRDKMTSKIRNSNKGCTRKDGEIYLTSKKQSANSRKMVVAAQEKFLTGRRDVCEECSLCGAKFNIKINLFSPKKRESTCAECRLGIERDRDRKKRLRPDWIEKMGRKRKDDYKKIKADPVAYAKELKARADRKLVTRDKNRADAREQFKNETNKMRDLRVGGKSIQEIADVLGVGHSKIRYRLKHCLGKSPYQGTMTKRRGGVPDAN